MKNLGIHIDLLLLRAILIIGTCAAFFTFSQDELTVNSKVEDEIRYEALLDYELEFEQTKLFLSDDQLFQCHQSLSYYFGYKEDYSNALRHGLEALNFATKLGDLQGQGEMHLKITNIHLAIQNADESIKSSKAAVDIFSSLNDSLELVHAYNSHANAYLCKGDFGGGLKYYTKALTIANQIDDEELSMVPIGNLGAYYLFKGEPDSALVFIKEALVFDRYSRKKESLAGAFGNMAYAYTLKEDYNLANMYFDSSFALANDYEMEVILLNLYKDRSEMHYALGDYKKSYNDLVEHQKIMDALKSSVSSEQISDWKVSYANEERKREAVQEQAKYERLQHAKEIESYNKWFIIILLSFSMLLILALFWRFRTKSQKSKEILEKNLELERLKLELSLAAGKKSK